MNWRDGVFGEVVRSDSYGIRKIDFVPDYVVDIGANVGMFSMMARVLFPSAYIISIEPDEYNFTELQRVYGINSFRGAISSGKPVYRPVAYVGGKKVIKSDGVGSHYTFVSENEGYPKEVFSDFIETDIPRITIAELAKPYKDGKRLLKCDCEGAEFNIFNDKDEFEALKTFHYIGMEVHFYAAVSSKVQMVTDFVKRKIEELGQTHKIEWAGKHMLHARMK